MSLRECSEFSEIRQKGNIEPASKEGEKALYIIDIARKLYSLTGGDKCWMRAFMHSENKGTGGVPAKQIANMSELLKIHRYVNTLKRLV